MTDFTKPIWVAFEKLKENFDNEHLREIYFKLLHIMFRIESKRGCIEKELIEKCLKDVYCMLDEWRWNVIWEKVCRLLHTTLIYSEKVTELNKLAFAKITRVLMKDEIADVSILIKIVNAYVKYGGVEFLSIGENMKDVFVIASKLAGFWS